MQTDDTRCTLIFIFSNFEKVVMLDSDRHDATKTFLYIRFEYREIQQKIRQGRHSGEQESLKRRRSQQDRDVQRKEQIRRVRNPDIRPGTSGMMTYNNDDVNKRRRKQTMTKTLDDVNKK